MYVAVEPSKLPPREATVALLTSGGDPQSAEGRSHSQNVFQYHAYSMKTEHTAINNSPSRANLLDPTYIYLYINVIAIAGINLGH